MTHGVRYTAWRKPFGLGVLAVLGSIGVWIRGALGFGASADPIRRQGRAVPVSRAKTKRSTARSSPPATKPPAISIKPKS